MPATLLLIFAAILYRVAPVLLNLHSLWTENFSPLASIVLCGAIFFPRNWALYVPLVILAVSDVILNLFAYHAPLISWEILPRYLALGAIGWMALYHRARLRPNSGLVFGASLLGSTFFYGATNIASWVGEAGYTKNFSGLVQSLTFGLEGYPPSYLFFRNSLVGDLLFTGLFLICMAATRPVAPAVEHQSVIA